jgi:hypothetical protein
MKMSCDCLALVYSEANFPIISSSGGVRILDEGDDCV